MKVTVEIETKEQPTRTLADLDSFVAAEVRHQCGDYGGGDVLIRWRDKRYVLGPNGEGAIGTTHCSPPEDYRVINVIGKLIWTFERD